MAYLGTPSATAEIIKQYQFVFQKKYGQNFLIDANILEKIIRLSEITKDDCVIEIGPGIGTMTQYLAESAGKVIAIEIDRHLIPILEETLKEYKNVTIMNEDVLKVDIKKIVEEKNNGNPIKVVANLPYYITTPIVMGLFESGVPLQDITIMVQKEVAERMQVGPGSKDYGALSLAVQYYARPEVLLQVPGTCFMPRPAVGSAVIRLKRYEKPPVTAQDEKKMFAVIRAAFGQRRKTLSNALAGGLTYADSKGNPVQVNRQQVCAVLEKMGIKPDIRGEALTLAQFAELSNLL
ncbi:MAG: 16S rRNA (adenine(1518)-N(6)/adenine(1519)-N(6))-dimethyltransferase RsmA [Lachnospiraceae bacterium]|nr:16S rRNA (adenine(1518)-N(6)/adenine(1519)-N(6))-dimethyltransferase RsmA [Lachnospiraceae bacterium]